MPLRGSRTPARRRAVTPMYSGLRGSRTRLFSGGGGYRRGVHGRSRPMVYRRSFRKRKMYRRTLPSTRQRTSAISSGLVQAPIEDKLNGTTSAFELAVRDVRAANNTITTDGDNYISFRMGTCYFQSIPWPYVSENAANSTAFDSKKRNQNHINLHGFKIHRQFEYELEDDLSPGPLVVNWALIQARTDVDTTELAQALTNNTFREHSSLKNETYSFEQYGVSSGWKAEMNYLPMNPDNKFKILTHKRMIMHPRSGNNYTQRAKTKEAWTAPNRWEIKRYYKVGKVVSFANDDDLTPQKGIYEVFWYNTENADRFPANPVATSFLCTQRRNITYWSE